MSNSEEKVIGEVQISGWLEEKGTAPTHVVTEPTSRQVFKLMSLISPASLTAHPSLFLAHSMTPTYRM